MTVEKWTKLDDALTKAYVNIKENYIDSGANKGIENDSLIKDWNDKINITLQSIRELQEEMIFTLKIED